MFAFENMFNYLVRLSNFRFKAGSLCFLSGFCYNEFVLFSDVAKEPGEFQIEEKQLGCDSHHNEQHV